LIAVRADEALNGKRVTKIVDAGRTAFVVADICRRE
jgi:hypothetical protein